jgi:hypothetical protein
MKIVRQYARLKGGYYRVSIRRTDYAHTIADLKPLIDEAKRVFDITDDGITVVCYGGPMLKMIWGIEFNVFSCPDTNTYEQIYQLPPCLA